MFQWHVLCTYCTTGNNRKQLKHNKFHNRRRPTKHLREAFLPKKLTQIYHKYLKRPHFAALFFTFFINNDVLPQEKPSRLTGKDGNLKLPKTADWPIRHVCHKVFHSIIIEAIDRFY